ncbi:hypothetical protein KZO01_19740 [Kurthia zopfii]|uniref:Uncharacterized protein n=1 Tax=Kurthia zopfii TaxID=1650 RepID=A0A8B4Q600_9BACL|nr:hypothetical protein [Kurthia zopfii]PWI22535.1 hypothetical protein DF281_06870 [Kurthia zopfii]TDR38664.1 hypothetical protein DFR61_11539 [Kurthia zopfii]GEK31665.1 hypothetical protein KZO01_19740 [Kurthia zopfii]STX08729.1 Uncharacterised protein [Kurthia zopfii]
MPDKNDQLNNRRNDKEKNEFLSTEVQEVEKKFSDVVRYIEKLGKDAAKIQEQLSKLKPNYQDEASNINFSFTRKHLNHYLVLINRDKKGLGINSIKNLFICLFFLLVIASIFFEKKKVSNFNFEIAKGSLTYEKIMFSDLIVIGIISIIIVHLMAVFSHSHARIENGIKPRIGLILILISIPIIVVMPIIIQTPNSIIILTLISILIINFCIDKNMKFLKNVFQFALSPDLFYASLNKESIKKSIFENEYFGGNSFYKDEKGYTPNHWNAIKIELKSYIQNCNWLNVIISVILAIIGFIIIKLNYIPYFYIQLFLCIIIFRIISRGIEVIISFYKDIVTTETKLFHSESDNGKNYEYIYGFKSSILNQKARLSLAIHTLFEFVILFAIAYYVFFNFLALTDCSFISVNQSSCEKNEITPPSFYEMLLFSGSLGVFNISYGNYQNILLGFLHVSQILISAVLILISIAQYAGGNSKLSSEEEALYRNAAIAERENESIDEEIQSIIEDKEKLDERIKKLNDGEKEKLGEKIEDLDKQICSINDEKKKLDDSYLRKSLDLSNS